jgi:hypothetical protein
MRNAERQAGHVARRLRQFLMSAVSAEPAEASNPSPPACDSPGASPHFSTQDEHSNKLQAMKIFSSILLATAIAAVSAAENSTSALLPASSSASASAASAGLSGLGSANETSSESDSAASFDDSAGVSSAGADAASGSDDVDVGDSNTGDATVGSTDDDYSIEYYPSDSDSGTSESGFEETASASGSSLPDVGSSSGAAAIPSIALFSSVAFAVAAVSLL